MDFNIKNHSNSKAISQLKFNIPIQGSSSYEGKTNVTPKTSNPNKMPFESSFALELIEYPFVTLKKFPRGYIQRFGMYQDIDQKLYKIAMQIARVHILNIPQLFFFRRLSKL